MGGESLPDRAKTPRLDAAAKAMATASPTTTMPQMSPVRDDSGPSYPHGNPMATHVKVVAVLNIIGGILAAIAAVFLLFVFGVGTVATQDTTDEGTPEWVPGVVASLGIILTILFAIVAIVCIAAGVMLLNRKRSGKTFGIIASILHIINIGGFPISTGIGIYGLVILLNKDTNQVLVE